MRLDDEDAFVEALLSSLGRYPPYFSRLASANREGLGDPGPAELAVLNTADVIGLRCQGAEVVDVRPTADYSARHVPGALAIPLRESFATWLGWLVPNPGTPIVIVRNPDQDPDEIIWQARKVGYFATVGELGVNAWVADGEPVIGTPLVDAATVDPTRVIDVRQRSEFAAGHLPGAVSIELGAIGSATLPDGPVVTMCGHGERRQRPGTTRPERRAGHVRRSGRLGPTVRCDDRDQQVTSKAWRPIALGLRVNVAQFSLLVGVNALVGGMLGQERTVVPLLATEVFGLPGYTAALTFILAFGIAKAATNYIAGTVSDRFGRKPVLVAGWLVAVPVPMLLISAPSWASVVVANVLLGISQGLTWSTTVVMKIDLVGQARRGLAMGFNEAAGYAAVALTAMATGYVAADHGLRPAPFYLGIATLRHRKRRASRRIR
jgi:rhodanese-related sulfurtransferase